MPACEITEISSFRKEQITFDMDPFGGKGVHMLQEGKDEIMFRGE